MFVSMQLMNNEEPLITNKKYYTRFMHDFTNHTDNISDEEFKLFEEKYNRRITRFKNILSDCNSNNKSILFLRIEENNTNRIIYDEYKNKMDEHACSILFEQIILKLYPNLKFKLVVISKYSLTKKISNNIIFLGKKSIYNWNTCEKDINRALVSNKKFLEKN